jgi:hypothetical protein
MSESKFPENIFGENPTNKVARRIATLNTVCKIRPVWTPVPIRRVEEGELAIQ